VSHMAQTGDCERLGVKTPSLSSIDDTQCLTAFTSVTKCTQQLNYVLLYGQNEIKKHKITSTELVNRT